jgi:hypothetical protein
MESNIYENDYILHNENEIMRLTLQHQLIKDAMNGQLVLAPIDLHTTPLTILDSCTADGQNIHVFVSIDAESTDCTQASGFETCSLRSPLQ